MSSIEEEDIGPKSHSYIYSDQQGLTSALTSADVYGRRKALIARVVRETCAHVIQLP